MAIIVETGAIVANADSYVDVATADAYFAILPTTISASWTILATTDKENYLKWATRVLEAKAWYEGYKTTDTSSLRWPRSYVTDRDGIAIGINSIPDQLQHAQIEILRALIVEDITIGQDASSLKSIKVDVIEIVYQDNVTQNRIATYINHLLTGIGRFGIGMSVKIRKS